MGYVTYDELYYYPYKSEALEAYNELKNEKEKIWREPGLTEGLYIKYRRKLGLLLKWIRLKK